VRGGEKGEGNTFATIAQPSLFPFDGKGLGKVKRLRGRGKRGRKRRLLLIYLKIPLLILSIEASNEGVKEE